MNEPLVSIGIPAHNAASTIAASVASALSQTYRHIEVIVVDDGSSDGTLDQLRGIRDSRLKIVRHDISFGLPARLNELTQLSRGDYLARMDADDLMHPLRLEKQVQFLAAHADVDVVGSTAYVLDGRGKIILLDTGTTPAFDTSVRSILLNGLFIHVSVTGKRAWFLENPYSTRYTRAEDRELWVRTAHRSTFARLEEPLMVYRSGPTGPIINDVLATGTTLSILMNYGPAILGKRGARSAYLRYGLFAAAYVTARATGLIAVPRWLSRMNNFWSKTRQALVADGNAVMAQIAEASSQVTT